LRHAPEDADSSWFDDFECQYWAFSCHLIVIFIGLLWPDGHKSVGITIDAAKIAVAFEGNVCLYIVMWRVAAAKGDITCSEPRC
jgi:hypothetical protein